MATRIILFFLACFASFAQITNVNIGTSANDNAGDSLRTAFSKLNTNNAWLASQLSISTNGATTLSNLLGVVGQGTFNNVAVKTNLTLGGKTTQIGVSDIASLLTTSTGIVDGASASVLESDGSSSIWKWSASSTASTNVDVVGTGTGRWIRQRQLQTPLRQTGYSIYEPTVTNRFILNSASSGFQYNHDATIAKFGSTWFAQWNANTNENESFPGQVNLQSTSTDFVTWTAPVAVFIESASSANPVTYSYATDLQWQPNLITVGSELWSIWSQQLPGTYPTGQRLYFSRLSSVSGKWTNNLLSLNYTENGMTFYPFPTQNPLQLQSGRVIAPLVWIATNFVSPTPPAWGVDTLFFTQEKRAGVIYTDDGGVTWKVGGTTTLPGGNQTPWEPVVQQAPDGSIRMYCRNLDYKTYNNSQYMMTAAGYSDGAVFGPLQLISIDTTSSRYGLAYQGGKFPRQLGFANDWKSGGFISDRFNAAVTFSRFGMDDFVFGPPFSGSETVVAYPQAVVTDTDIRVVYSQGSVPRSIKTAVISPLPDASQLYLLPRRNDYINPQVAFRSGPPAYFEHGANSVMYSVTSTGSWASTNSFTVGAWMYRTNNAANESWADWRNLPGFSGAAVGAVAGVPLLVTYSGSSPVNTLFSTLTVPTGAWCYVGFSVDAGAGTATAYVVTSAGSATTETKAISSVNSFQGSVAYIGDSQPGSSLLNLQAAVRHVLVIQGVAGSANNHRFWHGLDQAALGVSDWSGTETSPGTAFYDYWAADTNAGSNNSTWLAVWAATGNAVRGDAYSATVDSEPALTVTGTGSAGVELFPFTPGQQLVFGTQFVLTNKTSGYDQVIATIGGKSNRIDIVSRNANPTRIEAYNAQTGAYYDLAAYVTNTWVSLSLVFDGELVSVAVNNANEAQIPVTFKSPRLYLGTGYLDTWSINATQAKSYKLSATYCHVGTAIPYVATEINKSRFVAQSSTPSLALIDTDTPATNYIYTLGQNLRIGSTDQSSTAPFLFQSGSGNFTLTGNVASDGIVTSSGISVKSYAAGADVNQRRINGSVSAPSTVSSGDRLGATFFGGYDGASETSARGSLQAEATQTWSVGANGTRVGIQVTANGSATRRTTWWWEQDGSVTHTDTAPILAVTASNGTSGYRVNVTGGSGDNLFRILNASTLAVGIGSSGNIYNGTSPSPSATAVIQSDSTTRGWLPPRMTEVQRDAIVSPPDGLFLYNTTAARLQVRAGGAWVNLH